MRPVRPRVLHRPVAVAPLRVRDWVKKQVRKDEADRQKSALLFLVLKKLNSYFVFKPGNHPLPELSTDPDLGEGKEAKAVQFHLVSSGYSITTVFCLRGPRFAGYYRCFMPAAAVFHRVLTLLRSEIPKKATARNQSSLCNALI